MPVYFHTENVQFIFNRRNFIKKWIRLVIEEHHRATGSVNIIFTSNDYLLEINREYLNHNYNTDVITFEYNEEKLISGDIFVSIEQVKINAESFHESFEKELYRVIIHGVLHLLGFKDSTKREKKEMREEEDKALDLLKNVE